MGFLVQNVADARTFSPRSTSIKLEDRSAEKRQSACSAHCQSRKYTWQSSELRTPGHVPDNHDYDYSLSLVVVSGLCLGSFSGKSGAVYFSPALVTYPSCPETCTVDEGTTSSHYSRGSTPGDSVRNDAGSLTPINASQVERKWSNERGTTKTSGEFRISSLYSSDPRLSEPELLRRLWCFVIFFYFTFVKNIVLCCRLALYVYEYLLHVGAQKAAQTFLSEVRRRNSWGNERSRPGDPRD